MAVGSPDAFDAHIGFSWRSAGNATVGKPVVDSKSLKAPKISMNMAPL